MCKDKTDDERLQEIVERNRLKAIQAYAEIGDVESVLKEVQTLFYGRSYARFVDRYMEKQINDLFDMCYRLNEKMEMLEKQLAEMK